MSITKAPANPNDAKELGKEHAKLSTKLKVLQEARAKCLKELKELNEAIDGRAKVLHGESQRNSKQLPGAKKEVARVTALADLLEKVAQQLDKLNADFKSAKI